MAQYDLKNEQRWVKLDPKQTHND